MMKNKNQVHQKKMKIYLKLNGMNSMINVLGSIHTDHSTYFETKYKSFFSFIFKQLLQKMFDMGSMSIVN